VGGPMVVAVRPPGVEHRPCSGDLPRLRSVARNSLCAPTRLVFAPAFPGGNEFFRQACISLDCSAWCLTVLRQNPLLAAVCHEFAGRAGMNRDDARPLPRSTALASGRESGWWLGLAARCSANTECTALACSPSMPGRQRTPLWTVLRDGKPGSNRGNFEGCKLATRATMSPPAAG